MDGTLKLITSSLAFSDPNTSNNPSKRYVDWNDSQTLSVQNPKSVPYTIAANATVVLFSNSDTPKRYVELHADQDCVLRLNGDTTDVNEVTPWQAGDMNQMGTFIKSGPCVSATIVNKTALPLNILFITAE